ncbi:hypothetical protein VZT92_011696 [Zoarces viviparus]|uniref:Uncharacterized protein n=1 Tax=Zoarces viviparus TaxID=48416 RepID=A0AAW1F5I6_ZOAVI
MTRTHREGRMALTSREMLCLIGTACLWLPLLAEVVAEDSYLNEVQNSGEWEVILRTQHSRPVCTLSYKVSLHPASPPTPSLPFSIL